MSTDRVVLLLVGALVGAMVTLGVVALAEANRLQARRAEQEQEYAYEGEDDE